MDETQKPGGAGRGVKIALGLSLAVNLLIVGLVAGAMLSGGPRSKGDDRAGAPPRGGPYLQALNEEDRRATRRELRRQGQQLRQSRAEERADAEAFVAALRADPFDPAALEPVFQGHVERATRRLGIAQLILSKRITEMSVEERAAYAERIETILKRRR